MAKDSTNRDHWRWSITGAIILLPLLLLLGFLLVVAVEGDDWNKSLKSFPEQMAQGKQEMRRELSSLPAEDAAWGRSIVELLEDTNPIVLLTMMILLGAVFTGIFLMIWIIVLLYLFFGYYLVRKTA